MKKSVLRSQLRTVQKGAVVTTAALALALAGCSSDEGSSDSAAQGSVDGADGRGPITFAMGKNDTDKIQPIIEKWNKEHPEEKVTLKELAGEADAQRDTLVQSLQAGNSDYDVMALDVVWTAEFAANQWLAPLTDDLEVDTDGLLDSTVESATYNDTLYALPQNTNGQLLFRNTDLADKAPEKFADLKSACEALKKDTSCLTTQLKQYEGLTVNTAGFMEGWGGSVLSDDGAPSVDSAESKAGLQALVDAYKDGVISKDSTAATEEETNLAFTEGKSAFAINWPYMYTNAEDAGVKFEVQPLVGKDGVGVSTLGGYNNGININSEKKATALDFMKFIINEENQKSFAEASFPPVLASVYDDPALIEQFPYLPALKESLENAAPRPVSPFYTAISKAVQDNAYAALTADKSVDDATKDMKAAIEAASQG
ncbi:MAG: ABC transporter substrate-binding protein [Corynebacterium striatum]|uniref:Bacterial extracellular solute-binding family protein n=1 Tax=Corynebacterium simulans TaxID=146827 RepID=A0ABR5VBK8_9CORY|nr:MULTISPECIES: ABC transporter substrate-binding protein [Corynebacterium]MDU3174923.1 ABC transporter substrate-binding protein [Corynebacterium striatum]KXU19018.1 bacterial extracellular solute-binding family protein [Corynebacterium simulans]MCG7247570.1 ABC transporter substrate-binding protein [Corynebacterium simulans]MCK6160708.1 ABC transporter substrate-binding protein [Corynebacterium simulans]OFQ47125.1 ABC transporter substrate-binding protein [Corynebacterium sp. HMSC076D02]